jgi:hypothetical protein
MLQGHHQHAAVYGGQSTALEEQQAPDKEIKSKQRYFG